MNNFSKLAIVTAALALVAQGARAGANNDLILGFSDTSATEDYVIDLGQESGFAGQTSVLNLSGDVSTSTYNSAFGSSLNNVTAGVVGGTTSTTGFNFMTTVRSGAGVASSPMSLTPAQTATAGGGTLSSSTAKQIGVNAEGVTVGTVPNTDTTFSWTQKVIDFSESQASFSPNTTLSGTVYEDLWSQKNSAVGTTSYLGYFTFNFSDPNSPIVTWTSAAVAVPEPATYGLLAGGGLLLVALRRQFGQKAA